MLDEWILARRRLVKSVHASLFEKPLLRRAHVHALNESEQQAAIRFFPSLKERAFVVPNGISPAAVTLSSSVKSGFLYLGRLHPKKQVLELADAWLRQMPKGERLTIAGWGDPDYEASVRALAARSANIEFIGPIYGDAKSQLLARSRAFILPSLSEGLPMAALEALQHGCIPILTRECNLPELFENGTAFELKSDLSNFSQVMMRVVTMPEAQRDALSVRCVSEAAKYGWDVIADRMLQNYEIVAAK
jgi:glycosyltransferase involved in cell wall biosynthesis